MKRSPGTISLTWPLTSVDGKWGGRERFREKAPPFLQPFTRTGHVRELVKSF